MRKSHFCRLEPREMRLALAVRHLSSCETCLTEPPFGVFRTTDGHVSHCEKACFIVKNDKSTM